MKFVLQRVLNASVSVSGETVGEIGKGYLLLVGVTAEDSKEIADKMIEKVSSGIALRNIAAETAKKLDEANSKKDADNKTTDTEEENNAENAEAGMKKEDGDGPDKS